MAQALPQATAPTILKLEDFLPYRLSVLTNTISDKLAQVYAKQHHLTIAEWRVMATLGRFPDLSANDVAARTAMDKVRVSRAVAKLIRAGRLRRFTAKDDRRRSRLRLTDKGQAVYHQIAPQAQNFETALTDIFSAAELQQLDDLLARLHRHAEGMKAV